LTRAGTPASDRFGAVPTNVSWIYTSAYQHAVTSSIMVLRNRFNAPNYDLLSAKREDVIRRTDDGLKLASRLILVDQAVLGSPHLNVFM
jgi:hypothetical protein